MHLVELTVELADQVLRSGGNVLMKVFQGEGYEALLMKLKSKYSKVITRKPKASRPRSKEIYILGINKK
jgi:23S rRNA (uridine2552-2'-O)-methyltransferase